MKKNFFITKQNAWSIFLNFCFAVICITIIYNAVYGNEHLCMTIEYTEEYSDKMYAQLFYAESENVMNEDDSIKAYLDGTIASLELDLKISEYQKNLLRLDPINSKGNFSIKKITIYDGRKEIFSLNGKEFKNYIKGVGDANLQIDGSVLKIEGITNDSRLIIDSKFNQLLINNCIKSNLLLFYIIFVLYIVFGIVQIIISKKCESKKFKWYNFIFLLFSILDLALGGCLVYGETYLTDNFEDVPLGQLIYHLHTPLDGTSTESFTPVIISLVTIVIMCILVVLSGYIGLGIIKKRSTFLNWISLLGVIEIVYAVVLVSFHFDALNYFKYINQETTIYEDNYVDGEDVLIVFPEKKRNLIYIYMESMEISYADKNTGGGMKENYIPELTEISLDNECFGSDDMLNGAYTTPGATFTMGALVAQTSGVPINENLVGNDTLNSNWESENNYVPGVWNIGDVLNQQGYNQEFIIGSNKNFAGRGSYFKGHGDYTVFDYYTAIEKEYIDDEYMVWWGYEDKKLFEYAKIELQEMSSKDDPFNLTLLTVDTHFTDGYVCDLCENIYDDQYSNVLACSSRQVAEFVEWIKEQDFYDNTTIVLSGDHLTMDSSYMNRNDAYNFDRRTYFTIVNGVAVNEKSGIQRKYTTLDLYPTTLAALGVEIEGDRLGLGTNLYSEKETLAEEYGIEYLNTELLKDSKLYKERILYGKK